MSYHFYIYYQVPVETADELRGQVSTMQSMLTRETGIVGRLLTKVEAPMLWMEVYENVRNRDEFESILQRLIAETGVVKLCSHDKRKTEIFIDSQKLDIAIQ
ncbi:MAG: DUF4936 family protein [Pseudomonadota bacterium]